MPRITTEQCKELENAFDFDDEVFVEKLKEYTGITRKSYTAYNYFDSYGNYIGCSEHFDLDALLANTYVEVVDDEKA